MHPDISQLPSRVFYGNQLRDGPDMAQQTVQAWHRSRKFGPYRFFNVKTGVEERANNQSYKNSIECRVAAQLYQRLSREFSSINLDRRIGIVSMYRAQIVELRQFFQKRFGREILDAVDFNTVDGFQGQEKDIIILSCVRAGPGVQNVGFLAGMPSVT